MRHGFVKVAAATPDIRVADVEFNKENICTNIISVPPLAPGTGKNELDIVTKDDNAITSIIGISLAGTPNTKPIKNGSEK